ncbi:MAG: hypothetical protein UX97_C0003G0001, partial [Candidatus Beckwithbacteria bacterium GW2011_GWA2_47_25]
SADLSHGRIGLSFLAEWPEEMPYQVLIESRSGTMKNQLDQLVIPEKKLDENPLFFSGQGSVEVKKGKNNIFIGCGICTPSQLSLAVPFDIIGFILSAELIKTLISNSKVFLLVADQHAWLANHLSKTKAERIAKIQTETIMKIIKNFKLKNWQVTLASQLFLENRELSYEQLELRDINHFFNILNTGIKVGWKFSSGQKHHKSDEAHFDNLIKLPIKSLFIKPGLTLDIKKPHESPYICTDPKTRITLWPKEDMPRKISQSQFDPRQVSAVKNHLKRITILFEKLVEPFQSKVPLEEKIQSIIDSIHEK